jgi:hypothetical protein
MGKRGKNLSGISTALAFPRGHRRSEPPLSFFLSFEDEFMNSLAGRNFPRSYYIGYAYACMYCEWKEGRKEIEGQQENYIGPAQRA